MASLTHDSAPPALHPERALLTPLWIAALVLLVVNDHLLKGSGLLPGLVTGKLSDFAGLIVAPVLLASVLLVRDRQKLAACHVAVGLVFAGIQLSLPFAELWSGLMGLVGHPWTITSDPTDLIALPMLLVSWRLLEPAMQQPIAAGLRQLAVAGLSVFGLWATVATSEDDGGDWDGGWDGTEGDPSFEDVFAELVINNGNDHDLAIYVRPLRADVELDCGEVTRDPARMLPEHAFGDAVHWVLPARTNLPIEGTGSCGAVWVSGEGIPAQLLFWSRTTYPLDQYPGQYFELSELPASATAVVFEGSGVASWHAGEAFRFAPPNSIPELPAACEPSSTARIEWDSHFPVDRPLELLALDYGPDGCFELELLQLVEPLTTWTSYLCVPEHAFAFAVGERVRFDAALGPTSYDLLNIRLLDPASLDIARDEQDRPIRESTLIRAAFDLIALEGPLNHDLQASPRVACPWQADDHCATTEQPFDVRVAETTQLVAAGDAPVMFEELGYERGFTLVHGQKRAVIDGACGAVQLGLDLDAVITSAAVMP